jgi:integrase
MSAAHQRSPNGHPRIVIRRNRVQVHITHKGKKYAISLGLPDTPHAREIAQKLCDRLLEDVQTFQFDETLKCYYNEFSTIVQRAYKPEKQEKWLTRIDDVWDAYEKFKKNQVEQTTIDIYYANARSHIARSPYKSLSEAVEIRDYLLGITTPGNAKKMLSAFSTACNCACISGLIEQNPFSKLAKTICVKRKKREDDIDPFEREEVKVILEAFKRHSRYHHYYNFVRFLFNTGCRTSEAIGLKWEHIDENFTRITFCEALVQTSKGHVTKGLKSQERRAFLCNETIQEILREQKEFAKNEYVFPGKFVKHINRNEFTQSAWKGNNKKSGIVTELAEKGLIDRYRCQYQTRHTFITLALEEGLDAKDVARLVGNTPEMIYKHYAGRKKNLEVPELFK